MTVAQKDVIRRRKRKKKKGYLRPQAWEREEMTKEDVVVPVSGLQLDISSLGFAIVMEASRDIQSGRGTSTDKMTDEEFIAAMFKRPVR